MLFILSRLLRHSNIISLLGHTVTKNELIIVTNYVIGKNLDELLFGCGKILSKVSILY